MMVKSRFKSVFWDFANSTSLYLPKKRNEFQAFLTSISWLGLALRPSWLLNLLQLLAHHHHQQHLYLHRHQHDRNHQLYQHHHHHAWISAKTLLTELSPTSTDLHFRFLFVNIQIQTKDIVNSYLWIYKYKINSKFLFVNIQIQKT